MKTSKTNTCFICGSENHKVIFEYKAPPAGETVFENLAGSYNRQVIECQVCSHMISIQIMLADDIYEEDYNKATYIDSGGMLKIFNKIIGLDRNESDNYARCIEIEYFIKKYFPEEKIEDIKLLDVGSGLGIFPYEMNKKGYNITALDPDQRSISHISKNIEIPTICSEFNEVSSKTKYNFISFNKVLEHVKYPIEMLTKALDILANDGVVYFEVPDGEIAKYSGNDREEFFIEHHHIFSFLSASMMPLLAGYTVLLVQRVHEPSSKFTLRVFIKRK